MHKYSRIKRELGKLFAFWNKSVLILDKLKKKCNVKNRIWKVFEKNTEVLKSQNWIVKMIVNTRTFLYSSHAKKESKITRKNRGVVYG